jgi:glycyl-tRNA synthetase beta chain
MATLLLELFSEEIPSRMQRQAAEQLERLISAGFEKNMLKPSDIKTFVSPRHLAIQCFGLPTIQPDVKEEKRGPKIGAPEQAMKGFLQSTGLTLEQCEQRDGYYYATIERKGRAVADVVKEICEAALAAFSWPKSMRWGARPLAWVRPLHRIACLLDDTIVPVQFAHLTASNLTEGHRFMAPSPITVPHAEQYETILKDAFVVVDFEKRKNYIGNVVHNLALQHGLHVIDDDALLNEVTGLIEHAVPLLGTFEEKFLQLPPEVLISEMKTHQRYFALKDASGKLANQFITVANIVNADGGKKVIAGNVRVVRARLADGEFYWQQDRNTKLEDWGKKLSDVVFHAKVGMMDEKVTRIETLAVAIAKAVGYADETSVRRTAQLCKADLTSGMVGEFPELQGIMGRYYHLAAHPKETDIADAIRDHYKPLGASDSIPESPLAAIIAIADKLDSITSLFAAGEKPTGSKDPLALRRAALGVLRILDQKNWAFDLGILIFVSLMEFLEQQTETEIKLILNQANQAQSILPNSKDLEELHKQLESAKASKITVSLLSENNELFIGLFKPLAEFFKDRIFNMLRDEGLNREILDAVAVVHGSKLNTVSIAVNARRLATWLATDAGKTTLTAIKRSMNILAAEEKKSKTNFTAGFSDTLVAPAEKALVAALKVAPQSPADLDALAAPINQFFTDHLVTEEGFREARLSLLAAVRDAANTIADFSKIEG